MFGNFRQNVKEILRQNKITYGKLAKKSGISESTIKCFMSGANESRRIAEKIVDALDVSMEYQNGTYSIKIV